MGEGVQHHGPFCEAPDSLETLSAAKEVADALNKPLFIGEYGSPASVANGWACPDCLDYPKKVLRYQAANKVQLSNIWTWCGYDGCVDPTLFPNSTAIITAMQQTDAEINSKPPVSPCPCTPCPCPAGKVLPRTCDAGSAAADLAFCDHEAPVATRVQDLISRLTRQEKLNLVTMADTGFLPRLNMKDFKFFNTCVHDWWTSNATTFGMPVGMAASFDTSVMRQIVEVIGVESRALSQRDYAKSFDDATKLHGVAHNWLVCKDSSEVNMNRHPM